MAGEERTNATPLAENQEVLAKVLGFQTVTPPAGGGGLRLQLLPSAGSRVQGEGAPPDGKTGALLPLPWATRQHHLP